MTDAERPKRLSLSQIVELLLTRERGERSTVTLTRNARGDTQIEVTVRTGDDGEVVTVEDAERKAQQVYERLHAVYPPNGGHDNASVELSRNAKGETQIAVEVKTDAAGVPTLEDAGTRAREEYERARARYPLASGFVTAKDDK